MNAQAMTLDEIRKVGLETLNERLGAVGTIRFIQQTETGWGDYTADREKWLGNPDLTALFDKIQTSKKRVSRGGQRLYRCSGLFWFPEV